jgi:hypothetical protein
VINNVDTVSREEKEDEGGGKKGGIHRRALNSL